MSWLIAFFLGLVQGLTEFFPVSSSAHLKLTKMLFGIRDVPILFDLSCHLGTLVALLWFFKTEIMRLFKTNRKELLFLFSALLPLVFVYFLFSSFLKMFSEPQFLGLCMMITGGILFLGQKIQIKKRVEGFGAMLLIGTMQSAALIPGISRSASTLSMAKALGWNVKDAIQFSFLLSIPTILGGNVLEIGKLWKKGMLGECLNPHCLIGFVTSLLMGLLMIRFAIKWLEKGKWQMFAWYCLVIGILVNSYMYLKI